MRSTASARALAIAALADLVLAALLVKGLTSCAPQGDAHARAARADALRPHVVLISIDTLRADRLGCHGYPRDTTPNLDRVAAAGVRCANAYAQAPATVASHASLFTGRYPGQHGTYSSSHDLPGAEHTLAEYLAHAGYLTIALTNSPRFHMRSGLTQGFAIHHNHWFDRDDPDATDAITGARRPTFLFVHLFGPHEPYAPPEPYRSRWHPGLATPAPEATSEFVQEHRRDPGALSAEMLAYLEALYDADVAWLDAQLAPLLDAVPDDALLIVTSDHGEEFAEHGGLSHSHALHEELLRVPLLLRWPERLPAGEVVDHAVQLVDVVPTVLDLLGLRRPMGLAGLSLLTGRRRTDGVPDPALTAAQRRDDETSVTATLPRGRFRLLVERDGAVVLHALDEDPLATTDVALEYGREHLTLLGAAHSLPWPDSLRMTGVLRGQLAELRSLGYTAEVEAFEAHFAAPAER